MDLYESQISDYLREYLWPLVRISSFLLASPIYGARTLPPRYRITLALPLAVIVMPSLDVPDIELVSIQGFVVTLQQILIGVMLGFVFQLFLQLFVVAGQTIAMNMGLGFASLNDPANGVVVTVLSQFYLTLATMLFLSINGHLIILELLVQSFQFMPIGEFINPEFKFYELAKLGGWMIAGALVLALPVVTAILIVNIAFGVMSRSAPQMNIFAVGFPITLLFGLFIIWVGLTNFYPQMSTYFSDVLAFIRETLF
ncbi:flagellar biosynthetic protein FliR [Sessilibacter corallicola]|uniref:flagellar biosynthetic protein FliR n=1 Tax=Sessilibacter corallicola TaxID=2904075 RepID=UPI001E2A40E6|nr:flagellar biosynthetic protein FliR [Sessilibacter corallicola]